MKELDDEGIREVAQAHALICVPTGAYHRQSILCPCMATMALCCSDCGQPVFAVPVTGLPGCEHLQSVLDATA